ncbi:MAG: bifunctional folylpolyglutamate synthase/dihydrofolate synthase [Eubacteriales bacterium]|nr:bifunctional folylpolyglutamate synthase/dihydrofolate synthase [Eubacteriales bacterium]
MNYAEALSYMHDIGWRGIRPGLSRTRELMEKLGHPERVPKFIHVAGTNGKGSVCAMLACIMKEAGYKVGLYTSPYISRYNERIRINGESISDAKLAGLISEVRGCADTMADLPTEFEFVSAVGFAYFAREKCDIVVLETGLGGELDSTNVITDPDAVVITTIGYDHMQYLGNSIRKIASAKAGVIKQGCTVISYGGDKDADAVIRGRAEEMSARLVSPDFPVLEVERYTPKGQQFSYKGYRDLFLPMPGVYQPKNAAVVLETVDVLRERGWNISDDAVKRGLGRVDWPGRFQLMCERPIFILDGAHNPDGMRAVVTSLETLFPGRKVYFLIGVMADKDIEEMIKCISYIAAGAVTVTPDNSRAMDAAILANMIRESGIDAVSAKTVSQGVEEVIRCAGDEGIVCAAGSLYMSAVVSGCFTKNTDYAAKNALCEVR